MNEAGHFILLFQPFFTYFGVECYRFLREGGIFFCFLCPYAFPIGEEKRGRDREKYVCRQRPRPFFPLHGERGRPGETCEPEGPFLIVNIPSVAASVWALLENILSEPLVSPRDLNSYFHLL